MDCHRKHANQISLLTVLKNYNSKNAKFLFTEASVEIHIVRHKKKMSLVTRKSVFGMYDQVRLKPASTADETPWNLEISAIASNGGIILSRQRTTKALIGLRGCPV